MVNRVLSKHDKQKRLRCPQLVVNVSFSFFNFSFVNEDNYIGKVVIEVKEEEFDESEEAAGPAEVTALRRSYFNPNKSYIVLGTL